MAHLRYLRYVLLHKWFVFLGGLRFGAPLFNLIVHDWSKFTPSEWTPYVNQFYRKTSPIHRNGYLHDPTKSKAEFNVAWIKHLNRQPHHWQYWLMLNRDGTIQPLPMPERFVREMLADWSGAGRAQGADPDPIHWYTRNRNDLILHPVTRTYVEALLGYEEPEGMVVLGY